MTIENTTHHDFSGRVAFVTGGSSGIGFAAARAFARSGTRVVIAARRVDAGRAACRAIEADGGEALFVETAVRDEPSVARAVDAAVRRFSRLDFAVNSAGVGGDLAPLERTDQAVWDEVLAMRYEIPRTTPMSRRSTPSSA
jgi:NAD(P)-dependent dehydrogenase (short-subunit alcohol dehydrogenase family)